MIARLLVELLQESLPLSDVRERAARAVSRFTALHKMNQASFAAAGGIKLAVSLVEPLFYEAPKPGTKDSNDSKTNRRNDDDDEEEEETEVISDIRPSGEHRFIQKELASALWSISVENVDNQAAIAKEGGLKQLIALLSDEPDIHRDAAGALWSLAQDADNRRIIAEDGGIPMLVELLKSGSRKNLAEETAAGALRVLARRPENRDLISDAGGIGLLVPLFDGGTDNVKAEVAGALLTLVIDNPSNQYTIASKLVSMLAAAPDQASEANNVASISRVEASEHASRVLHQLTLDRDNKDALARTPVILQSVRMLKGGSDKAQKQSADALTQIARMSAELRIQVTQQLVTLLGNANPDVRQRAGKVLKEMNDGQGEDQKNQKEAAMAGGVSPLVELLKDGLKNNRIEAQEYALWSLSMTADAKRGVLMVREGCIRPLIATLTGGELSLEGLENAAVVLSSLAIDRSCHEEIIQEGGIPPLVKLLTAETLGAKKHAAIALSRIALGNPDSQARIAQAGALGPLVS